MPINPYFLNIYYSGNELGKEAVNNKLITKKNAHQPVKTKGELTLEDLPPIEDLKISVSESECVAVGKVYQIVDKLGELSEWLLMVEGNEYQ